MEVIVFLFDDNPVYETSECHAKLLYERKLLFHVDVIFRIKDLVGNSIFCYIFVVVKEHVLGRKCHSWVNKVKNSFSGAEITFIKTFLKLLFKGIKSTYLIVTL